jgi:nitrate reductase alpha subunit
VGSVILSRHFRNPRKGTSSYLRQFSDAPVLVELTRQGDHWKAVDYLRADRLPAGHDLKEGHRKLLAWDSLEGEPFALPGTEGFLRQEEGGLWNLELSNPLNGNTVDPALTLASTEARTVSAPGGEIPVRSLRDSDGEEVVVATIFDWIRAERGLSIVGKGSEPLLDSDLEEFQRQSGISKETVLKFSEELFRTAASSNGRCMVLGGESGLSDTVAVKEAICALLFCGCIGVNGGGVGFYSGQRKVIPLDSFQSVAFARDWVAGHRIESSGLRYSARHSEASDRTSDSDNRSLLFVWNTPSCSPSGLACSPLALFEENGEADKSFPGDSLDLIVSIDHEMSAVSVEADVVLPTTTMHEKSDLNSCELTQQIQPVGRAVAPPGETRSEWEIFRGLSKEVSRLAKTHLPGIFKDSLPDPEAEKAVAVNRFYPDLEHRFSSIGPLLAKDGLRAGGISIPVVGGRRASLGNEIEFCDCILSMSSAVSGPIARQALEVLQERSGVNLTSLRQRWSVDRVRLEDLQRESIRQVTSPVWSGICEPGVPYAPFSLNLRFGIPWKTLSGRQQLFFPPSPKSFPEETLRTTPGQGAIILRMELRPAGGAPGVAFARTELQQSLDEGTDWIELNPRDAALVGVWNKGWVEVRSDRGWLAVRCRVSQNVPEHTCLARSANRTVGVVGRTAMSPSTLFRPNKAGGTGAPSTVGSREVQVRSLKED